LESKRYFEIDFLKCVCILIVVYFHSYTPMTLNNSFGIFFIESTRFVVPGLFFASGFLFDKKKYSTDQIIKKKLGRLLPPYLFCSLCFQFLNVPGVVALKDLDAGLLVYNLIIGDTLGAYWFVFVLLYLFAGSLVLRLIPDRWVWGLWGLSALLLLFFVKVWAVGGMSFTLFIRHPFFYLFDYLSGWIFSLKYESISLFLKKHGAAIFFSGIVPASAFLFLIITRIDGYNFFSFPILTQLYICLCITLLIIAGMRITKFQGMIQFVSNRSYGIYLLHFPIICACHSVYSEWPVDYSPLYASVSWCVGLAGSILIIFIIQKLSGRYSKYLIGC